MNRAYRAYVPRMWPQQMPCWSYREVSVSEAGIKRDPVVSWEDYQRFQSEAVADAERDA
jgi:hypothetical protein